MEVPEVEWDEINFRNNFEALLSSYEKENSGSHRKIWTKAKVEEVINNIKHRKNAKTTGGKLKSMEYYWSSKYDCVAINGEECITFKKKNPEDPVIRIIPREEFFDALKPVHISCGHGGRDKMLKNIKNKFYVPKKAIEIFSLLCPICGPKKNSINDLKTMKRKRPCDTLSDFNTSGIVDVIDFQANPDGEYNWLLKYQDFATKFVNLRPLKSKEPKKIALELLQIFFTFGPPSALQSLTGSENIDEILKEIRVFWPSCKIINETIISEQRSQARNQRNNAIVNMLLLWMNKNNLTNWSVSCFLYQYFINSSSAYKSLFCRDPQDVFNMSKSSTTPLSKNNVTSENKIQNLVPETEIAHLVTDNRKHCKISDEHSDVIQESYNINSLNDIQNQSMHTQVENKEIKAEVKIEYDDSETYNQYDYKFEHDVTSDYQYERKNSKQSGIYEEHNQFDYNLEAKHDEPYTSSDSDSETKLVIFKTEPTEETDPLIMTCVVCQNSISVDHTLLCYKCKNNIHETCGTPAKNKKSDIKECFNCTGKGAKSTNKKAGRIKRADKETNNDNTAKRVKLSVPAVSGPEPLPGPSSDPRNISTTLLALFTD